MSVLKAEALVSARRPGGESWHGPPSVPTVVDAVAALRAGLPVLLTNAAPDACDHIVLPAATAEPSKAAWMVRHSSGLLFVALPAERADALRLPPMVAGAAAGEVHAVAVDARLGVTTGISARDRTRTARLLADERTRPTDLTRPGHVIPIRVHAGSSHLPAPAGAASILCRLADLPPVALLAKVEGDQPVVPKAEIPAVSLEDVHNHILTHGEDGLGRVTRVATTRLPTAHGELTVVGYRDEVTGGEHLALSGRPSAPRRTSFLHLECVGADALRFSTCACRARLDAALEVVARVGGVVVYIRRPGVHLFDRSHAWTAADRGAAASILADLGHPTSNSPGSTRVRDK